MRNRIFGRQGHDAHLAELMRRHPEGSRARFFHNYAHEWISGEVVDHQINYEYGEMECLIFVRFDDEHLTNDGTKSTLSIPA